MSSLLTNASALTALQSLEMTQQNLATTQSQISTGLAVASAADNASYWSIAQNLQSDTGVLGAVNDSLAQSQSILGSATAALNDVITTINSIKTVLTEAAAPNADYTTLNTTLSSLGQQLTEAVAGASFNGYNLLDGSNTTPVNFVAGYNVSANGVASFNSVSLTPDALTGAATTATTNVEPTITDATQISQIIGLTATTGSLVAGGTTIGVTAGAAGTPPTAGSVTITSESLTGEKTATTYAALDANGNATNLAAAAALSVTVVTTPAGGATSGLLQQGATDLTNMTTSATAVAQQLIDVNAALTAVTSYSSEIGSISNILTNASNFNSALSNNYTTGIGALVDADMNQASTRLQALQTQQQLGVQSLSIANQSSQLILKLFQ
jgi:flagellin